MAITYMVTQKFENLLLVGAPDSRCGHDNYVCYILTPDISGNSSSTSPLCYVLLTILVYIATSVLSRVGTRYACEKMVFIRRWLLANSK